MGSTSQPTFFGVAGVIDFAPGVSLLEPRRTTSSQDPQPDGGTDLQKELDEVAAGAFFGRVGVDFEELIFWKVWYKGD